MYIAYGDITQYKIRVPIIEKHKALEQFSAQGLFFYACSNFFRMVSICSSVSSIGVYLMVMPSFS